MVLAGLDLHLQRENFDVIVKATNVEELISGLQRPELDIVITDYSFGGEGDGLRMIERVRRLRPEIKIIVFSRVRPVGHARQLMAAGADAFVSKTVGLGFVTIACNTVQRGARYIDPSTEKLLQATSEGKSDTDVNSPGFPETRLSAREHEVLRLLAQGLSIREIAQRFQRSAKTVSVQKCAAMSKLGLSNEIELALYLSKLEEQ